MSDEEREVDIESDDDDDRDSLSGNTSGQTFLTQAERRAHHNALERKRRDHIKESFNGLRDSVPCLQGEKVGASRAQILKQATDYISFMTKKNNTHQHDIEDLKRQNAILEQQVSSCEKIAPPGFNMQLRQPSNNLRALEKAKAAGTFAAAQSAALDSGASGTTKTKFKNSGSESSESEAESGRSKKKKLKT